MLLETFDYLSLLTCFGLDSTACGPVPTVAGQFEQLTVTRVGPWEVALEPFPFVGDRLELDVVYAPVRGDRFNSDDDLRRRLEGVSRKTRRTAYRRAG